MKVLFAVNNENISDSIIKLYQKEYREIISGKNVYYFNAIIKELQRDQTYDRIIISEDLEPYTNNNFDIIDKFLFEQLDKISDEATSGNGRDIPIIFIATDRRSKSDNLLAKLFSIGIYDALLGSDRNIPEVCRLLNKPRTKKEAKVYYKIESDEVSYQTESEDSVSETEIRNILTHYKKLGKNTERYVDSFNNIAAQYNDMQLRIITKYLPLNVKAVLEAESPKYQSIMTFGEGTYKKPKKEEKKQDLKIGFIETGTDRGRPTKPVVIPTAVNKNNAQKLTKKPNDTGEHNDGYNKKNEDRNNQFDNILNDSDDESEAMEDQFDDILNGFGEEKTNKNIPHENNFEQAKADNKRGRGRPKKHENNVNNNTEGKEVQQPKRGRGRPKKHPLNDESEITKNVDRFFDNDKTEDEELSGFEEIHEDKWLGFNDKEEETLPGFNEIEDEELPGFDESEEDELPGFDETEEDELPGFDDIEEDELPGFDDIEEDTSPVFHESEEEQLPEFNKKLDNAPKSEVRMGNQQNRRSARNTNNANNSERFIPKSRQNSDDDGKLFDIATDRQSQDDNDVKSIQRTNDPNRKEELTRLLSRDKKVVAFVGTSKARNFIFS